MRTLDDEVSDWLVDEESLAGGQLDSGDDQVMNPNGSAGADNPGVGEEDTNVLSTEEGGPRMLRIQV